MITGTLVKALKNNAFKAVFAGFTATTLSLGLTACGPVDQVKSAFAEDAMPPMPAPGSYIRPGLIGVHKSNRSVGGFGIRYL